MHYRRKYEACKSKTETLRDENVFLKYKVKTDFFFKFQIPKFFIVIFQTFIVPTHRVSLCVRACTYIYMYDYYIILLYMYAGAVCAYVCVYMCAYVYVRTCMRMCMRICVRAVELSRVRALVRAYVSAYVCAYVCA